MLSVYTHMCVIVEGADDRMRVCTATGRLKQFILDMPFSVISHKPKSLFKGLMITDPMFRTESAPSPALCRPCGRQALIAYIKNVPSSQRADQVSKHGIGRPT